MSSCVLDASALMALLRNEPGADAVRQAISQGAAICTVNVSEVVAKLNEAGMPVDDIRQAIQSLGLTVADFNMDLAYQAGVLRAQTRHTRHIGLSLGDRACLALAIHLNLQVVTADRACAALSLGPSITVIR